MNQYLSILSLFSLTTLFSCNGVNNQSSGKKVPEQIKGEYVKGTFGYDLNFLKQYHKDLVVLGVDSGSARVIVLPAYQGRVMTSSAEGNEGASFGWVNHAFIAAGKPAEHINVFGGEERFWIGPEGGQFSIYFKKGVAFTFDNWFVPKELDTESFKLIAATKTAVAFEKEMHLENYTGNKFDLMVKRTISLLSKAAIDSVLGIVVPEGVKSVAFESDNTVTNLGKRAWDKNTGMISIWVLSMLNATDKITVAIPYKNGDAAQLGKIVTDDYFGKVPAGRLKINNGLMLFKADAKYRSKIGVAPARALPLVASYDALNIVLTIAQFKLPEGATDYVNSLWKIQEKPFAGDAVNAYNDGPVSGKQLGQFYELESSSPAAALAPLKTIRHIHRTIHLKGDKAGLNKIAMKLLGVGLDEIIL